MNNLSPLTGNNNVKLKKIISINFITSKYKKFFDIDIKFENIKEIYLYECLESGLLYYYPTNIDGDGSFYEKLSEQEFYYMPWKWEHEIALEYISNSDKVLEIGCGKGDFIKNIIQNKNVDIVGLELNPSALKIAQENNLPVLNETIEEHSSKYQKHYDIICCFQVLEHVSNVRSFIESSLKALKTGGKLIISVPNNDSFIKDDDNILNMPPHHLTLWNQKSLTSLTKYFSLELEAIKTEPLQQYHYLWYLIIKMKKICGKFIAKLIIVFLYNKLGLKKTIDKIMSRFSQKIIGHTIIAIYKKVGN